MGLYLFRRSVIDDRGMFLRRDIKSDTVLVVGRCYATRRPVRPLQGGRLRSSRHKRLSAFAALRGVSEFIGAQRLRSQPCVQMKDLIGQNCRDRMAELEWNEDPV